MKTIILYSFSCLIFVFPSCIDDNTKIQDKKIDYKVLTSMSGQTSVDTWGIGIISDNNYNSGERLNFPVSPINIYDQPNGEVTGIIYRETEQGYDLLIENLKTKTVNKINRKDFIEVTYEGLNLKYYKDDNGFINCFTHSIDSGVWIKKDELENLNFQPIDWKGFLIKSGRKMYPTNNTSIPLFDNSGQFTDSLKYGDFEMKLIDKEINNLIKVEIYNPDECAGGDGKKVGEAWIELIDKNGHLNVFYYSRGC